MKGISSHRKYNPTKSKIVLSLYALMSCVMKVAGTILFFQATLGLHDSLRHLQGSQAATLCKMKILFNLVIYLFTQFLLFSQDSNFYVSSTKGK